MSDAGTPDPLDPTQFDAILFDLDGVLTETATVHRAAWKAMFDEFLEEHAEKSRGAFRGFTDEDYERFVDGKPRFDGVRSFLSHRGIVLPEGSPDDPPSAATVAGLGNRKNEEFNRMIDAGVSAFEGSVRFVQAALDAGIRTAVVSSSANAGRVIEAAGIADLFAAVVDGVVARDKHLPGKPAPDTYLEAARMLDAAPPRAVVVEDALSGVAAGRSGGFGLVIGIGADDKADDLRADGADIVVRGLGELLPD